MPCKRKNLAEDSVFSALNANTYRLHKPTLIATMGAWLYLAVRAKKHSR
jgi:hypothetical protein